MSAAWRPATAEARSPAGTSRILLLIAGGGNRQQIERELAQRFTVVHPEGDALPADGFDLAIADGPGLRRWNHALREAKAAAQPVFLPLMLLLPRTDLRDRRRGLSDLLDDFITTPIDRTEFMERVQILLRARQQALEQRDELVRLVNFDRATGLPNRHLFTDRVQAAMRSADTRGAGLFVAVIHVPLAHVLESVGELAVEEAAMTCSAHLCDLAGENVDLARLRMDQWGVRLFDGGRMEAVFELCARIDRLADCGIEAGGETVYLAPRIGVASYPADADSATGLIDAAIAAAGRARGGEPAFYTMEQCAAALHYLRTEAGLREAFADDQFELWLQPKVPLQAAGPPSAEALIRWRLPSGAMVPPGDFIPVAETSGLIRDITRWVIATAFDLVARTGRDRGQRLHLALNITPVDVQQPGLSEWLRGLCREHDVAPGQIEFELTETMVCDMDEPTLESLHTLRAAGFGIAIDDFGTGYSSLGYLHRLPANTLKIDRRFIDKIPGDSGGATVTRAIIDLAQAFNLQTVAEGVEDAEQIEYLRAAGVDYGQGFHIARPMPETDFRAWLARARANGAHPPT